MEEKLAQIVDVEGLAKELETVETMDELQAAIKRHGVDLTADELAELQRKAEQNTVGELQENELENVAGGTIFRFITRIWPILRPTILRKK